MAGFYEKPGLHISPEALTAAMEQARRDGDQAQLDALLRQNRSLAAIVARIIAEPCGEGSERHPPSLETQKHRRHALVILLAAVGIQNFEDFMVSLTESELYTDHLHTPPQSAA